VRFGVSVMIEDLLFVLFIVIDVPPLFCGALLIFGAIEIKFKIVVIKIQR